MDYEYETRDKEVKKIRRKSTVKGFVLGVVITLIVCIVIGGIAGVGIYRAASANRTSSSSLLNAEQEEKLQTLTELIETYYYGEVTEQDLTEGIYKGVFSGMSDIYSSYYTKEEFDQLYSDLVSGSFYGIGASLQKETSSGYVLITHVYKDSPAEKSGLKDGDIIVEADGFDASTMDLDLFVQKIRGEEGTDVHLKIQRTGENGYLEFDITREEIKIETVNYEMLEDQIGYIRIYEFTSETYTQFKAAYDDLEAQGMTSLLIDLRENGGGVVDTACQIADMFLPEGTIVTTEYKNGQTSVEKSDKDYVDTPVVLLVNGYSASASEIFAGAMRDYDRATLVGTKTFGKGIVQNVMKLDDGSGVKLTVAKYYLPNGDCIHGQGIEPDVELPYEFLGGYEITEYDKQYDNQIQKGIELLKGGQ